MFDDDDGSNDNCHDGNGNDDNKDNNDDENSCNLSTCRHGNLSRKFWQRN